MELRKIMDGGTKDLSDDEVHHVFTNLGFVRMTVEQEDDHVQKSSNQYRLPNDLQEINAEVFKRVIKNILGKLGFSLDKDDTASQKMIDAIVDELFNVHNDVNVTYGRVDPFELDVEVPDQKQILMKILGLEENKLLAGAENHAVKKAALIDFAIAHIIANDPGSEIPKPSRWNLNVYNNNDGRMIHDAMRLFNIEPGTQPRVEALFAKRVRAFLEENKLFETGEHFDENGIITERVAEFLNTLHYTDRNASGVHKWLHYYVGTFPGWMTIFVGTFVGDQMLKFIATTLSPIAMVYNKLRKSQ
jgi:hypothetical protein